MFIPSAQQADRTLTANNKWHFAFQKRAVQRPLPQDRLCFLLRSQSRNPPQFMETESSSSYLQQPATFPHPEPDQSSSWPPSLSPYDPVYHYRTAGLSHTRYRLRHVNKEVRSETQKWL